MILKKVEGVNSAQSESLISDYLNCSECIHSNVCKWKDKKQSNEELQTVLHDYPFIEVKLKCREFVKSPEPECDLTNLIIEHADEEVAEEDR